MISTRHHDFFFVLHLIFLKTLYRPTRRFVTLLYIPDLHLIIAPNYFLKDIPSNKIGSVFRDLYSNNLLHTNRRLKERLKDVPIGMHGIDQHKSYKMFDRLYFALRTRIFHRISV